jgi:hypothetical protein
MIYTNSNGGDNKITARHYVYMPNGSGDTIPIDVYSDIPFEIDNNTGNIVTLRTSANIDLRKCDWYNAAEGNSYDSTNSSTNSFGITDITENTITVSKYNRTLGFGLGFNEVSKPKTIKRCYCRYASTSEGNCGNLECRYYTPGTRSNIVYKNGVLTSGKIRQVKILTPNINLLKGTFQIVAPYSKEYISSVTEDIIEFFSATGVSDVKKISLQIFQYE